MTVETPASPRPLDKARRWVRQQLSDRTVFFAGFLDNPGMVGAVAPTSPQTIAAMLAPVRWEDCRVFVEYGPGVGTFTRPVLDRLGPGARLVAIDTSARYVAHLRATIDDPRLVTVQGSAAEGEAILAGQGLDRADYVLSGLPFATLPPGVGEDIAAATHRVLREGGAFLAYQFALAVHRAMARHFTRIDRAVCWRNLPPYRLFWGWKD